MSLSIDQRKLSFSAINYNKKKFVLNIYMHAFRHSSGAHSQKLYK